ncbi:MULTISPECIES: MFS transporter [Bacillus]|uniref:MFS transporter n=1 Tax=Bacillus TaxID=1386 RepID=UPI0002F7837C|nr:MULTISPECIES: MFS transporter [Bacillus]
MDFAMFKPLKLKAFRSLFGAQIFSDFGNWLDIIALQAIVVFYWGLDETAAASVLIVLGLPWVIIGPFASVFTDRLNKRTVMIVCLYLRMAMVVGLFFSPNLYFLLLFAFLKSTVAAIYDPARQSTIRSTVPPNQLAEAVTLSQLSVNTMKIIGPALGGLIMLVFNTKSPFIFEGISFFIALLFILNLPKQIGSNHTEMETTPKKAPFIEEFKLGIQHIFNTPLLKTAIILSSIAFFIIFLYDGLFSFVAKKIGFSEEGFALLISAVGFGSVAGALLLGRWTNWKTRPIHYMAIASVFSGSFIVLIGLGSMGMFSLPNYLWILVAFILGILASIESIPYGYVLQSETPQEMMGRVSAAATSSQTFSMLFAPAAGAFFAKLIGISSVFIVAGLTTFLLGIFILSFVVKKGRIVQENSQSL